MGYVVVLDLHEGHFGFKDALAYRVLNEPRQFTLAAPSLTSEELS